MKTYEALVLHCATDPGATVVLRWRAIALVALLNGGQAIAGESDVRSLPDERTAVWINPGMLSHHFDRSKGYQENNYGLGAEVTLSNVNSMTAGAFRNSDNAHSRYLGWMWQPLNLGPVKLGLFGGGFDGYPKMRNGGWFFAALPVASFEYRAVGINVGVVPNYADRLHGAVVAQFKLRVW